MNVLFTCILIGISLSMDAFSLALLYGTYGLAKKEEITLSVIVGLFHFFMPLIGLFFGNMIFRYFVMDANFVVGIIFGLIGFERIISSFREEEVKILIGFVPFLLFFILTFVPFLLFFVPFIAPFYELTASSINLNKPSIVLLKTKLIPFDMSNPRLERLFL